MYRACSCIRSFEGNLLVETDTHRTGAHEFLKVSGDVLHYNVTGKSLEVQRMQGVSADDLDDARLTEREREVDE